MSVFNAEETVASAIQSLLNQSYENIEILIVDDCSTDSTFNICNDFAKKSNNILLYKNDKNIGLTKSLNFLISKSNGNLIARQDADDISDYRRIEKQIIFMNNNKLDASSTRAKCINKNKTIPGFSYYLPKKFIIKFKNPFIHGSLIIKKDVLNEIGLYNEHFYFAQDYKLMNDLLKHNFKVGILKKPLYNLNTENNISKIYLTEQNYYAHCVRYGKIPDKKVVYSD